MSRVIDDSEGSSPDELQNPDIEAKLSHRQAQVPTRSTRSTRGDITSGRGRSAILPNDEYKEELPRRGRNRAGRNGTGKLGDLVGGSSSDGENRKAVKDRANPSWRDMDASDIEGGEEEKRQKKPMALASSTARSSVEVIIPAVIDRSEYVAVKENDRVDQVIKEIKKPGEKLWYIIRYEDGRKDEVPFQKLTQLINGENALDIFNNASSEDDLNSPPPKRRSREESTMSTSRAGRPIRDRTRSNYVDTSAQYEDAAEPRSKKRRLESLSSSRRQSLSRNSGGTNTRSASLEDAASRRPKRSPSPGVRTTRSRIKSSRNSLIEDLTQTDTPASEDDFDLIESDILPRSKTRASTRRGNPGASVSTRNGKKRQSLESSGEERPEPTRVSGRANKAARSMREVAVDEEVYADSDAAPAVSKTISVREVFKSLPLKSKFATLHNTACDVCDGVGMASNKGASPLIHCQGCTTSIHKVCLGYRSARDHRVTKIGDGDFVMQCRRCIGLARKKDHTAPRLDMCQNCRKPGKSCAPFSKKLTTKQEEKLRDENNGTDPITAVSPDLINNADNILFRCGQCQRGFHFDHLPPLDLDQMSNSEHLSRAEAIETYTEYFQCKMCADTSEKVQTLVAWRPIDVAAYDPANTVDMVPFDDKEYLVKWVDQSYFRCTWRPGSWIWGTVSSVMRKAFDKRDEGANLAPKMTTKDAVPEEFLRMEIVLDVEYSSRVSIRTEEVDKARVKEVDRVYVKFHGLGYDEVVWEQPPEESDTERWAAFVAAYNEYVAGQYFKQPPPAMNDRIQKFRALPFESKVMMAKQPESLSGGEMMAYQMEGLNWLLYKYHEQKNVILADEMGLGKTIQVIALLATLIKDRPKCWPFLVVVPNSTCPNWRREIKKWAPSLRVVAYYGERSARDTAMQYELYPDGCKDMRAHVVVTSFDAPVDDHSKVFFRKIKWTGMIVDEGQRLKNDKNLLYGALSALKVGFKVLLTGTPLQNNKRELFNLLQFLDTSIDAEQLDEEYAELTNENLPELHERIRPFFLRRTKAQVLKFLPPMAQVIIPVTMSVVQKKLYKSILAKNPELIKAIFGNSKTVLRPTERGNLNNILIQLRKCLCHPFIYSDAIEERELEETILHRNLVDASSKLQLLEIMLPKLHERGHRVLIFSQFLDQLNIIEDFLIGLGLEHERLDGTIGTLEKQRRIDAFNAPDSPLFAFLLSTRAGGVGINLATADTVIIMDPDFNPHQDIQALSRAHRIGQKKKVLVFQLMTKDSAEEKIVQIGRKKMALDHVLIESMEADEDAGVDLENILKHGAEALFNDDDGNDIHYDSASVDKLLDRTDMENTNTGADNSAESQFSFARIWANDKGVLTDDVGDAESEDGAPNPSVWDAILKQREADAAIEAAKRQQVFGRGKRQRQAVDYQTANAELDDVAGDRTPRRGKKGKNVPIGSEDEDFAAINEAETEDESDVAEPIDPNEVHVDNSSVNRAAGNYPMPGHPTKGKPTTPGIKPPKPSAPKSNSKEKATSLRKKAVTPLKAKSGKVTKKVAKKTRETKSKTPGSAEKTVKYLDEFKRAQYNPIVPNRSLSFAYTNQPQHSTSIQPPHTEEPDSLVNYCHACRQSHVTGKCPLRVSGVENCPLCYQAHYGGMYNCVKLTSEIDIRKMLDALKRSTESPETVANARHILKHKMAEAVQRKKIQAKDNSNGNGNAPKAPYTKSPYFPIATVGHSAPPPPQPHSAYRPPAFQSSGYATHSQQGFAGPSQHGYPSHPPQGYPRHSPIQFPSPHPSQYTAPPQAHTAPLTGTSGHGHPQTTQPPSGQPSFKVLMPKDSPTGSGLVEQRESEDGFRHWQPRPDKK